MGNYGTLFLSGRGVKKDFKTAVKWIKKSAQAGNPSAYNNLANLLMAKSRLEEALKYSKIAVKKKPKTGIYWNTLETILAKFSEKQAAFKAWDRALELTRRNEGILKNARKYGYQG